MRVLLTTYGSRGVVQSLVGLAVQVRALGAEVQVCAPPDQEFADLPRQAAEMMAAQFDAIAAAAEKCDAPLAIGVMPTGEWR
jgi:vancomycin aglycone glucosyltransferase